MKLLLISLASLVLYTSVFAHPSKRHLEPNGISSMDELSGSEDVDEWVGMMEEECGMKMEQLDKLETVTPAEVFSVVNSAAQKADDLAFNFSRMQQNIEGRNIEQMMSDTNLCRKFERLVEAAFKNEMCEFISMQMVLDRISYMGADGFTDPKCTQTYRMVSKFEDVADKPKDWLLGIKDLIKSDVKCIIRDIAKKRALLRNLAEKKALSLREVNMQLASAMAIEGIVADEIERFHEALHIIHEHLVIDVPQLAVPAVRKHGSYLVEAIRRFNRRA